MRKQRKAPKAQHYQLSWNVFNAVEIVEQYEKQTGDTSGQLPLPVLMKIYQGSLLTALQFGTIPNHQTYGVTFFAKIKKDSGEEGIVERGFRIDTPMKLSEFINGYSDCYVNKGQGIKTKGWKGAKEEWLSMMDKEFKGDTCLDAWAVANCLHKGNVAKAMTRRYKEAQNEVIHVQVESVEGEYVSPTDYRIIQIEQMKAEIEDQRLQVEEIKARMRASKIHMQQEALIAALSMFRRK